MPEEEHDELLRREELLRDSFTPAEQQVFVVILIAAFGSFWIGEPRSYWLLGSFLIAACLTPFTLGTHQVMHPFHVSGIWKRAAVVCLPVWVLLIQFVLGLIQDPLTYTLVGEEYLYTIQQTSAWWPVSARADLAWPTLIGLCSIYVVVVNLFLVPKSRAFFDRLMPKLCAIAVLVGIFGLIQAAARLEAPLLTKGTGRSDFFAFFPYDGHWAAFAALWASACVGMSLLRLRQMDPDASLLESKVFHHLFGGIILGSSAFVIQASLPAATLMLTMGTLLMIFTHQLSMATTGGTSTIRVLFFGLLATGFASMGIIRIAQAPVDDTAARLRETAINLFGEKPMFGWGVDSFPHLLPFYGSDFLNGEVYARASSDLLQALAELGIIGASAPVIILAALLLRYVSGRHDMHLTNQLLVGCGAVAIMTVFDSPFMSPSVLFSFLTLFFVSLRWADLSRNKVDEVDKETFLIPAVGHLAPKSHSHHERKNPHVE